MLKGELIKAYLALGVVCLIWGTTYLAIRIGVETIPPFFLVAIRQMFAGIILSVFIWFNNHKSLSKKEIWWYVLSGILMITLGNGLVAWAELYVSSGLAALLCALNPFWLILLNLVLTRTDRPNFLIWLGMIVGLLGLLMIFGDSFKDFANMNYTLGILAILLANVAWALGMIFTKKVSTSSNILTGAAIQMFAGGVVSFGLSFMLEDVSHAHFSLASVGAVVYLVIFGSILTYSCYLYALNKLPVVLTSMHTYINPIVALILGWVILNEKLNLTIALAFLVTIFGVFLVNWGFRIRLR
jgi:drug/metabolite transporter (DMT)-like permease